MVNDVVYDYIKKYLEHFGSERVKTKVLKGGYSEREFNEALKKVKSEQNVLLQSGKKSISLFVPLLFSFFFLAFTLYFAIASFIPELLLYFTDESVIALAVGLLILLVLSIFYYFYGFFKIGSFLKAKMLRNSSIFLFVFTFFIFAMLILLFFFGNIHNSVRINPEIGSLDESDITSQIGLLGLPLSIQISTGALVFFVLIFSISYVFYSIGLIKVRKNIWLAFLAGIVNLVFGLGLVLISFIILFFFIRVLIDPSFFVNFTIQVNSYSSFITLLRTIISIMCLFCVLLGTVVIFNAYRGLSTNNKD